MIGWFGCNKQKVQRHAKTIADEPTKYWYPELLKETQTIAPKRTEEKTKYLNFLLPINSSTGLPMK